MTADLHDPHGTAGKPSVESNGPGKGPVEKNGFGKESRNNDEPYIRDVTAMNFAVQVLTQADALSLCEGQAYFCEMCGQKFPLWPIRLWAAHYVDAHHDEITVQQSSAVGQFCTEELSQGVLQWIAMQLLTRTEMRRRARDLGLIRFNTQIGIVD